MMRPTLSFAWLTLAIIAEAVAGHGLSEEISCGHGHLVAAAEEPNATRSYAPDRTIDILHLALDVRPDFDRRTVSGRTTLQFKPIAKPVREVRLDAVRLTIRSVRSSAALAGYHATDGEIVVTFAEAIPAGEEVELSIEHEAQPEKGLYFRTPAMGYAEGETQLFTQGEAIEARHWFPNHDYPNEKFTSEIICRVPEGMKVLSNGRRVSEEKDPESGLVAVHWRQEKPHVNYLITLAAGYFETIEDRHKDIPLAFHTPPSDIALAENSFRGTKEMMAFFEEEIGLPYPWAKYDQVVVRDFMWGGMENTSLTTLTDRTLFPDATENLRSSEGLVAHELAHQWFGNLVTCKDWSHLWLNEGFATYYAHLYDAKANGRDSMLYDLYGTAQRLIASAANDTRPIIYRKYTEPESMFRALGHLIYGKGGWVLHMLRSQLGDELFRRCIRTYLERHQYGTVVTEDLNSVLEELSGQSLDRFFDQWVYHGGLPVLEVNYSWDPKLDLAKLSVRQTQKTGDEVLVFEFPLTVRFTVGSEKLDRTVRISAPSEDFYFPLAEAPKLVRIDPELTVLADVRFRPDTAMLEAQMADAEDVIGRLLAIDQLSGRQDHQTVAKLRRALREDSFWGARVEASRALRKIHTEESFAALADSTDQADARVRRQVVSDLGDFYREEAYEALLRVLDNERNPDILAEAIRSIGAYSKPGVHTTLISYLNVDSFRNVLADAAIRAIRSQDDPAFVAPLLDSVIKRETAFTSGGYGQALGTLAHLARGQENKENVRNFIAGSVNAPNERIQLGALAALGTLKDTRALPILQTFAAAREGSAVQRAAERAIENVRAAATPAGELRDLRNDVLEMQKANRELREQVEDLKKRFEALQREADQTDDE